jgi:diguanylate cyclase (GGDEF)-like protein
MRRKNSVSDVQPILAEGSGITVTVSIGSIVVNPTLHTEKDALSSADAALYQAKNQGRNRVVFVET